MKISTARTATAAIAGSISLRAAARRLGVHLRAVQKRIEAGTVSILPDGKLDWSTVQREWIENRDQSKVREAPVSIEAGKNFLEAKTRREYIRLERDELELRRRQGELASIGEINAFVAGMILRAREILTAMPAQLKDRLAQQTRPEECEQLIAAEVRRALDGLREFSNQKRIL